VVQIAIKQEVCKSCMFCAQACPKQLFSLAEKSNDLGYIPVQVREEECTGCGFCAAVCPECAFEIIKQTGNKRLVVAQRPNTLYDYPTTYCPGCSHGIVQRLIAEVIDEMGIREETVGITSIGCSIFIYKSLNIDYCEGAHGRAPAVATGFKRVQPEKVVFTYQGDGDIASIGLAEIIHAAARNENFTVVFVNNGNYGMTGGQMAPTTLINQITTTTPYGRNLSQHGQPIRVCELLAALGGEMYLARGSIIDPHHVRTAKKYIRKAFERQIEKKGFSLVEILGNCPTNWNMSPVDSLLHIIKKVIPVFPLGEIKVLR